MDCLRDGFLPGQLLGSSRYQTISALNHGSFGMVISAKDTHTGRDVAVKCLTKPGAAKLACPANVAIDEQSEELAIHSRLNSHPHIVNLLHHFETEYHQYLVLELCSNGDLYEAIRVGRGPLETEHVRDFMLQLIGAVEHLHANGVYHRDIKPENIFLTSSGSMKLGDFGLATTDTWSTEFAVGSDRYMAPEQFGPSVYGYGYSPEAADVWAIGIVLLNVLFQRNPFATPTQEDLLFADFACDRQSLFDVFPNMSQDTYNVLVHSMALDPGNRSLAGVREALKAAVRFTTDDEALDAFCISSTTDLVPVATATREPLRTPSITSPATVDGSFPWPSPLKTPQQPVRQLSTIHDEETDLYPGSVHTNWQYADTDEASLASNVDSGLGMSYKSSAKSIRSAVSKPLSSIVGSLPISFSRPSNKATSPYGASGSGFSKSWSDLWDEDEEMEMQSEQAQAVPASSSVSAIELTRVETTKPSTPQQPIVEEEEGSATPRPAFAVLSSGSRAGTASPLRQLVEHDKKHGESPKQRSSFLLDKWAVLGNFRRAKVDTPPAVSTPEPKLVPSGDAAPVQLPSDTKPMTVQSKSRDRSTSWRSGSPTRQRSVSLHAARARDRREKHPMGHTPEAWTLDNDWRKHMSPVPPIPAHLAGRGSPSPPMKMNNAYDTAGSHVRSSNNRKRMDSDITNQKSFLDVEFADDLGDLEWVGGWRDFV